jgi:transposase
MRQVREVLRLKHVAGHSERRIAAAIGISRSARADWPHRYVGERGLMAAYRRAHKIWEPSLS